MSDYVISDEVYSEIEKLSGLYEQHRVCKNARKSKSLETKIRQSREVISQGVFGFIEKLITMIDMGIENEDEQVFWFEKVERRDSDIVMVMPKGMELTIYWADGSC